MALTDRDRVLIEELSCFGILSTSQIGKLFFENVRKTTVLRRLRLLEKAKLIRREGGLPEGQLAWISTQEGNRAVGSGYPIKRPNRNSLEHDLVLSDLRVSLEGAGLWESWTPEHALKAKIQGETHRDPRKEPKPVPDALIVCRRIDKGEIKYVTVAIEVELHSKNQDRYKKIFTHYQRMTEVFAVWYFVPTRSLGFHLQNIWDALPYTYQQKPRLLWTLVQEGLGDPSGMLHHGNKPTLQISKIFELSPPVHPGAHGESGETATDADSATENISTSACASIQSP